MDQEQYLHHRTRVLSKLRSSVLCHGVLRVAAGELVAKIQEDIQAGDSVVSLELGAYSNGELDFTVTLGFFDEDDSLFSVPVALHAKLDTENKTLSFLAKQLNETFTFQSFKLGSLLEYSPVIYMIDRVVDMAVEDLDW